MATRSVLNELADTYAHDTGQRVDIVAVGGVDAARRIEGGEAFDFAVLASDVIDRLTSLGRIVAGSRSDLVRSEIAVAVRAGAPHSDIGSERALREAVLRARAIGYSTGPSGTYLLRIFDRWGIAATIGSRLVQAPPGIPVAALLARGEVELGFQQSSELPHVPGVDVVGMLPPELQKTTVFSGGICSIAARAEEAAALLAWLAAPAADAAKLRHGLHPARAPIESDRPSSWQNLP